MTAFERDARGITKRVGAPADKCETYSVRRFDASVTATTKNAVLRCDGLKTVKPPEKIGELALADADAGSVVKAKCSDGGVDVFRVGRSLYAKNAADTVSRVQQNCFSANSNTVIFHDCGVFYMTDGTRLLTITDALSYGAGAPYIPTVMTFTGATSGSGVEAEEPNALSDYVNFSYSLSDSANIIYLPSSVKVVSVAGVRYASGSSYSGTCTLGTHPGGSATLGFSPAISGEFTVTLKLGTSNASDVLSLTTFSAVRSALYAAKMIAVLCPGMDGMKKTLMISSGDTLYALGMRDGAYVSPSAMISTSLDETATAMLSYSDGALIFSHSQILFASVSGGIGSAVIVLGKLKPDFGCDMPGSAVGFDDKIFFANSSGGIYYIDKFGLTERDGSCHVSALIDDELLSNTDSALEAAVACATAGAYFISVGGTIYVWHRSNGHPTSPDEPEEKSYSYNFSCVDLVDAGDFIGVSGDKVYMIEKSTGYVYRFDIGASGASTDTVSTEMTTLPLDFGSPHEKAMTKLTISAKLGGDATVKIYFDGVEAKSAYTLTPSAVGDVCSYVIKPERHKFRSVTLKMTSAVPLSLCGAEATFFKTGT